MTTNNQKNEGNKNNCKLDDKKELPLISDVLSQISSKLSANIGQANSIFINFDHIKGESEIDRFQIFSNLLRAAVFLGLDINKIDFHRKDA